MRTIVYSVFILAAFGAFATTSTLVEFVNGNQIFGSYVTIYSDGTIAHSERNCCPPATVNTKEAPLPPSQMDHLVSLIAVAAKGRMVTQNGSPTAEGSESGYLKAYDSGMGFTVYQVDRNENPPGPNKVTINESQAAEEIKKLVESYAKWPFIP